VRSHIHGDPLLQVKNLTLQHSSASGPVTVLQNVNLTLARGEILGIIGESGAGKSTLGNALIGLLGSGFRQTSGTITLDQNHVDATRTKDLIPGKRFAAIFQDHTASLDPLMTIGAQLTETILAAERSSSRRQAKAAAVELLERVGIGNPSQRLKDYPHQFSGGQRQRIVIAIALAANPDIIVADEPTSALDATVQKQILQLLRKLVDETGISIVLVTHDMGVVSELADRVMVMKNGLVVEENTTVALLDSPQAEYTRLLLRAVPRLQTTHGEVALQSAQNRSDASGAGAGEDTVLLATDVCKTFAPRRWAWGRDSAPAAFALRDVSIRVARGNITGIVGESGSGKTTIGRIIAGLERASAGTLVIGQSEFDLRQDGHRSGLLGRVQMIFQDPSMSLNPRMTVNDTLLESLRYGAGVTRADEQPSLKSMIDRLGLPSTLLQRYPHQLSGGQKQRVCIGRALLAKPTLIVADEPTSALDVSVQAEIIQLLKETIRDEQISMIFISHDLAVVQELCSNIYIFRNGKIEDAGAAGFIFSQSDNPYTRALIGARPARFTH